MSKRQGILTYTNATQWQETVVTDKISDVEFAYGITKSEMFHQRLSDIFVTGSQKRSSFFMSFRLNGRYVKKDVGAFLPVCGVKGQTPGITRDSKYAQILTCMDQDVQGYDFFRTVFERGYLSGEETVTLTKSELLALFDRDIRINISSDVERKAIFLLEKIWEIRERDPKTRILVRMANAEKGSTELLATIYRLLPDKLRRDLGFMTNAAEKDLDQISNFEGLPLYLFTIDESETISKSREFPVETIELAAVDKLPHNQARMKLLQKASGKMDEKAALYLDYIEKSYLAENGKSASSFRYYEEILSRFLAGGGFWWDKTEVSTVAELAGNYNSTRGMMVFPEIKEMAHRTIEQRFFVDGKLYADVVKVVADTRTPNREELLRFLREDLGKGALLDAIEQRLASERNAYRQAYAKEKEEKEKSQKALEIAQSENTKLKADNRTLSVSLEKAKEMSKTSDSREDAKELKARYSRELQKVQDEKNECIAAEARKTKIFLILAIALGLGLAAFLVLFLIKNGEVASLRQQTTEPGTESELDTSKSGSAVSKSETSQPETFSSDAQDSEESMDILPLLENVQGYTNATKNALNTTRERLEDVKNAYKNVEAVIQNAELSKPERWKKAEEEANKARAAADSAKEARDMAGVESQNAVNAVTGNIVGNEEISQLIIDAENAADEAKLAANAAEILACLAEVDTKLAEVNYQREQMSGFEDNDTERQAADEKAKSAARDTENLADQIQSALNGIKSLKEGAPEIWEKYQDFDLENAPNKAREKEKEAKELAGIIDSPDGSPAESQDNGGSSATNPAENTGAS